MRIHPTLVLVGLCVGAVGAQAGCSAGTPGSKTAATPKKPAVAKNTDSPFEVMPPAPAKAPMAKAGKPCLAAADRKRFAVLPGQDSGSGVVLLKEKGQQGHTIALVADKDRALIHTVDIDKGVELARSPLVDKAAQLIALEDGRVVASIRDASQLQVLQPMASGHKFETICRVKTPTEPIGLAKTKNEKTLLVSTGWSRTLSALETTSFSPRFRKKLAREPRQVLISNDQSRAFVAHVVNANMSVVDLNGSHEVRKIPLGMKVKGAFSRRKKRLGCQGFSLAKAVEVKPIEEPVPLPNGEEPMPKVLPPPKPPKPRRVKPKTPVPSRVFAPFVAVDPGDQARRSSGYGTPVNGMAAEISAVSVVDMDAERNMTRSLVTLPRSHRRVRDCVLPRDVAYHSGNLYVACMGISAVLKLDARSRDPARTELKRWYVSPGPSSMAIDHRGGRAVVFSEFGRTLSVIDLASGKVSETRLKGKPADSLLAYGRRLFHKAADTRISEDGRACASCHPDGREDALTWSTPDGPRQTIMLTGRLKDSGPFSWSGKNSDVKGHVITTFTRLKGTGLKGKALKALVKYVTTMRAPRSGLTLRTKAQNALVEEGKAVFFDAESGCSSCHGGSDPRGSDHKVHKLGTRARGDRSDGFETPELRFVSQSAPYFHDGRYPDLMSLLSSTDEKMGHTLHLSHRQRKALAAYLETLLAQLGQGEATWDCQSNFVGTRAVHC